MIPIAGFSRGCRFKPWLPVLAVVAGLCRNSASVGLELTQSIELVSPLDGSTMRLMFHFLTGKLDRLLHTARLLLVSPDFGLLVDWLVGWLVDWLVGL